MTDIDGKEIKIGQIVAFVNGYRNSCWVNYGEVINISKTLKKQYCEIKLIKTGNLDLIGDNNIFKYYESDNSRYKKLLVIKDV